MDNETPMNLQDRALSASIFSFGRDGRSATDVRLPADALVIVIEERPETTPQPFLQWNNYHRVEYKSQPGIPRQAGNAYLEQRRSRIPIINVSG